MGKIERRDRLTDQLNVNVAILGKHFQILSLRAKQPIGDSAE